MPHSTRLKTLISRSYLCDSWLNAIDDPLAREAFLRMKIAADNCGRLPGGAAMLCGILYPGNPPSRPRMTKILETLAKGQLIFHYHIGRESFVEICDTGRTQELVGYMSDKSEYPPPPQKMIEKWESFTGQKRAAVKNPNLEKRYRPTVHTGIAGTTSPNEPVSTGIAEGVRSQGVGVRSEVNRVDSDSAKSADANVPFPSGANAPPAGEERTYGNAIKNPTAAVDLHILTGGHFDRERGLKGYGRTDEFLDVVRGCFEDRRELPLGGKKEAADFMTHVVNRCQGQKPKFDAPRGWMAALSELRRELED